MTVPLCAVANTSLNALSCVRHPIVLEPFNTELRALPLCTYTIPSRDCIWYWACCSLGQSVLDSKEHSNQNEAQPCMFAVAGMPVYGNIDGVIDQDYWTLAVLVVNFR